METLKKTAIETIRRLMKARKLSQAELARLANVEKGHLNRVLRGRKPLAEDTAARLANFFGVQSDELFLGAPARRLSPSISDARTLLQLFENADDDARSFALATLTKNLDYLPPDISDECRRAFEAFLKTL